MNTFETDETRTNHHSLAPLLKELRDETTTLIRQEVALAKAEMKEKVSHYAKNAAFMVAGGLVAYAAFIFVLLSLRDLIAMGLVLAGLGPGMAVWLGPMILGIIIGAVGGALIAKGKSALQREGLTPKQTAETLREDRDWARNEWTKRRVERKTA